MLHFLPHSRKDILLRVKWLNNKRANRYAIDNPEHKTTVKEQNQWFDNYEKNSDKKKFFTIFFNKIPIGFMGLSNINYKKKRADAFIFIGEDNYRNRGFGKKSMKYLINYAFKDLGICFLDLGVNKKNISAINLYRELGFVETKDNNNEIKMILEDKVIRK